MKKQTYIVATVLSALLLLPISLQAATSKHEALFYAARAGQSQNVANLIKQGANVNFANRFRETPMHAAAARGQVGVMQFLRSKGGRHNISTVNGWFPLHHAVRFGHVGAAQYLLQLGSPVHARTRDGKSVFDIAQATRNRAMIQMLQRYRR
ncbi:MAG: ankyrin repeat domain-containing protein [Thiolinea sp.]